MRPCPSLLLLVLVAVPLRAQSPLIRSDEGRRLDSLLQAAHDSGFHGSVYVLRRGEPVLLAGYGLARHRPDVPFTPATPVQIGSNVKDFTATAVYQLVEGGRLRLDDSLHRFFPGLPADKRAITVRHLLRHRAGPPLGVALDQEPLTRDEMLRRLRDLELNSSPGEQTSGPLDFRHLFG